MAAWPLLMLALWVGQAQAALRVQLDERDLGASDVAATRHLIEQARMHLPDAMQAALESPIRLHWSETLDAGVSGHAGRNEILLDRTVLTAMAAGDAGAQQRALATLLHELAHLYDRVAPGGSMSRDPRLLDLAGWQVRATRTGTRLAGRRENRFVDRSPDRYELSKPVEFVAVNLEYFLLDGSYACRRPALHRYFSARLGPPPAAMGEGAERCARDFVYVDAGDGGAQALAALDPQRVYAVDYLLADSNDQVMSRWGHSMLRLVVCAPGRAPGPDCRLDLSYHLVLSFRAFVGDVQLSSWRGLTGRYPSRLFVLPLTQVVDEYTKVELRGLRSTPLRLAPEEIAGLLERAAQLHWSYDGRYYFLSNNCAVETYKLLHDGVPRLATADLGSITPTGVLHRLERAGIADPGVFDDPAEALRLGYRFESLRPHFQQLFEVARLQLELPQTRVEDWMSLDPAQRRPWIVHTDLRSGAALLLLEQAAQRRQRLQVQEALKRKYLGSNARPAEVAVLQRLLQEGAYLGRPAQLLEGTGYGLPQAQERAELAIESEQRRAQLRQLRVDVETGARELMAPTQRQLLDGIAANSDLLGQRLRALHAAEGGMRLP
ncbi:DUF4105 domain-containing protein [Lysobacter sp. S4-A87]|uniref:Lnb N-terminal periplasmic domain-containing protein n=1 Tax=Lysobacter sp. S4-A87 TaxID=2925843 RepID=UPI001F5335E0|nr:DUF4105 domain-containing protein [Lysobacter sp. S4-A87]UNK49496.1 DUF4105 domain-containing protein [Lysobacter sp. S4-A87]